MQQQLHTGGKMADPADEDVSQMDCPLHKCIFEDDYRKLSQLIRTHDVGQKDKHGKFSNYTKKLQRTVHYSVYLCLQKLKSTFVVVNKLI